MDQKDLQTIRSRLVEVNLIISKLDPAIKIPAFELLKPFILGIATVSGGTPADTDMPASGISTHAGHARDFFVSLDPKKPADSVLVLTAWIYTQRGSEPFSLIELEDLFDEVGVPRPARLDMTLRACSRKGKKFFTNAGYGKYRPTVYAENHFKQEMNLRPGKRSE